MGSRLSAGCTLPLLQAGICATLAAPWLFNPLPSAPPTPPPPPTTLQDEVHASFESILDLASLALRIPQADMDRLPEILQAVPEEQRQQMQRSLARVWQR